MNEKSPKVETELHQGEVAAVLPPQSHADLYFIGTIHTPWHTRQECPKRGSLDGPVCSIVVDERWAMGLTNLGDHRRIQVLYWMHRARRDLVLQNALQHLAHHRHLRPALAGAAEPDRLLDRRAGGSRRYDPPGAWARLPRRHAAYRFKA